MKIRLVYLIVFATILAAGQSMIAQTKDDPASLDYITGEEEVLLIIRPAKLYNDRKLAKLKNKSAVKQVLEAQSKNLEKLTGVGIQDVDQVTLISGLSGEETLNIFRTVRKDGFEDVIKNAAQLDAEGIEYYQAKRSSNGMKFFHVVDRQTIIWASNKKAIESIKDLRKNSDGRRANWRISWRNFENDRVIFVYGRRIFEEMAQAPMEGMYGSLAKPFLKGKYIIGSLTIDEQLKIFAEMELPSRREAVDVKETTEELVKLGKMSLGQFKEDQLPKDQVAPIKLAKKALNSYKLNVEGERVVGSISIDIDEDMIAEFLGSTFGAATRTQSANNIRQLGIAMHNYHDAYGHLPPAVIVSESGHRHSWRIEILPFIEQKKIYDNYRFDEPWNSKHNAEVTKNIPEFFKHPDSDPDTPFTDYFAVVGTGTAFEDDKRVNLAKISDGTSNTIMLIEAKQKTHWAKPEDIPFDSAKVKAVLGGYSDAGANVLFCDCSVQFLPKTIEKEVLHSLLTIRGGEVLDRTKLDGPRNDRPPERESIRDR